MNQHAAHICLCPERGRLQAARWKATSTSRLGGGNEKNIVLVPATILLLLLKPPLLLILLLLLLLLLILLLLLLLLLLLILLLLLLLLHAPVQQRTDHLLEGVGHFGFVRDIDLVRGTDIAEGRMLRVALKRREPVVCFAREPARPRSNIPDKHAIEKKNTASANMQQKQTQ